MGLAGLKSRCHLGCAPSGSSEDRVRFLPLSPARGISWLVVPSRTFKAGSTAFSTPLSVSLSLSFFFLLFNSNMKEHQDLYSVFLKLCSVLFYICPVLDNWRTLLFCLFCVFSLQYFSPSFSVLLMNLSLMMKIVCCEKILVGFIEEARQVGCQIFPQLS